MSVVLALLGAVAFALGSVLQHRVAGAAPPDGDGPLLLRLARRPTWLLGVAADGVGFVLQALALAAGRLAVVQPVLASSLVFALPIAALLDRRRPGGREVLAAVAVTGGLIVFLVAADPSGGRDDASVPAWLVAGLSCGLAAAAAGALARRHPAHRGVLLGAASGVLLGLCAALLKATVERVDAGLWAVAADWHVWALLAVGYAAMTLTQASLAAGPMAAAVAAQLALDPITSLLLGTLAFGEHLHETPAGTAGALLGVAIMTTGICALATTENPPRKSHPQSPDLVPSLTRFR